MIYGISFSCLAQEKNTVKEDVADAVSGVVTIGKDALSGVKQGVEDGRKGGESLDGAIIISNQEELRQYATSLSVSEVKKLPANVYEVVMVLRNDEDKPVRLINLVKAHQVMLLDDDGVASNLMGLVSSDSQTAPAKAAVRFTWRFSGVKGKPSVLRIYNEDVRL